MENVQNHAEDVSENGILHQEEFNRYKARSIGAKFRQQLFLGIGGALLFGIISSAIMGPMISGAALSIPLAVAIGVPLAGVAFLFVGIKCMLEAQLLNQEMSAKMVGAAVGKAPAVPEVTPEATKTTPIGMSAAEEDKAPTVQGKDEAPKKWAADLTAKDPAQGWSDALAARQTAASATTSRV